MVEVRRPQRPVADMPERERPISEQYRIAAAEWVELDAAARMLEECKTAVLSRRMSELPGLAVSKAEMEVKASEDWMAYLHSMVDARTAANRSKIEVDALKMRHMEQTSREANARVERKA